MIISDELNEYILKHSDDEEDILKELYRKTNVNIFHPRMLSGHIQGRFLYMICKMIRPANILEIGTYTGYSAISMALALDKESKIVTIDKNDEIEDFTREYMKKSKKDKIIEYIIGDALQIIPELNYMFDIVFIDGEKREYPEYYDKVFPKLNKGGFIIADNTLWDGKVIARDIKNNDYDTKGIIEFNKIVKNDNRVEKLLLPVRDGLMLIRKK